MATPFVERKINQHLNPGDELCKIVDISRVPTARAGDEVVLIGKQRDEEIAAIELAMWFGTVPWEVLTAITYRVPRIYIGGQAS